MTTIGITGPTGAGKSTFLLEVERRGGVVIDCDKVYHGLLEGDFTLQKRLEDTFGSLRDEVGHIDRKKLGQIVFHNPDKLEMLNAIAWKAVVDQVYNLLEEGQKEGKTLAAIDAIALLESPLKKLCKLTVAVLASPETRVRRIMARESISADYAWARVKSQQPDEYFSQNCDYVLVNDFASPEEFAQRSRNFLEEIL